MHPASYAEWIALIERYRRAVKAYSETVRVLASMEDPDYEPAQRRVEEAHRVCESLRAELLTYQEKHAVKPADR
ncbi:MAG TPA: hypothetical protein VMB85_01055 [Bryobacteraceae bacterium]|jgi:hypothetical protein|nr:hypothetical protein [Bryobacteraceae bacterium]